MCFLITIISVTNGLFFFLDSKARSVISQLLGFQKMGRDLLSLAEMESGEGLLCTVSRPGKAVAALTSKQLWQARGALH